MPRKHRKKPCYHLPSLDFAARILFLGYSMLWDMEPGFNPINPDQPGFRAFPYFGA